MVKEAMPTVFISFNNKSRDFVDSLDARLKKDAYVIRYEDAIADWGSFKDFMNSINKQDFAVLVITDAYLKSRACMYEVTQVMNNNTWLQTTMFVVVPGTKIYSDDERIEYIQYWTEKYSHLEEKIKKLPASAITAQIKELKQVEAIRDKIGEFLTLVADAKNPHIWDAIESICNRVSISPKAHFVYQRNDGIELNVRQVLILEALLSTPCMTVRQIAEQVHLSQHSANYYLNELVEKGLIYCEHGDVHLNSGYMRKVKTYRLAESA